MKNPIEQSPQIRRRLTRAFFLATLTASLLTGRAFAEEPGIKTVRNSELFREGYSASGQVDMNILNDAKRVQKNPAEFVINVEEVHTAANRRAGIVFGGPFNGMTSAAEAIRDVLVSPQASTGSH